jgi:hypothetical protein
MEKEETLICMNWMDCGKKLMNLLKRFSTAIGRYKKIVIPIVVLFGIISPNIFLGVCYDSFDRYKFVEEWYKSIFQIVLTLFLVDYYTRKSAFYRRKAKIDSLLSTQLKHIDLILDSIREENISMFIDGIEAFYVTHLTLREYSVYPYSIIVNHNSITESISLILKNKTDFKFSGEIYRTSIRQIEKYCTEYKEHKK